MTSPRPFSLIKPSLTTPFHIDFDWWKQNDSNWRIHLLTCLCPEHKEMYEQLQDDIQIDWIDPETAEVHLVDGLQHTLMTHCVEHPDFLHAQTSLVESVFRVLLANGNTPMTAKALSEKTSKPAHTILRTFSSTKVYKGIRPCPGC